MSRSSSGAARVRRHINKPSVSSKNGPRLSCRLFLLASSPLKQRRNKSGRKRLTCDLVDEDPGGDDASVLREKLLQLLLRHGLGQTAHVQVSVSDGGRTWAGVGHLTAQHTRYRRLDHFISLCNPMISPQQSPHYTTWEDGRPK